MKRAIVFSGGGAKGMFAVGVLDGLLKRGIKFDVVAGVSVGALIGAMVAQGKEGELKDIFQSTRNGDVYRGSPTNPLNIAQIALGKNYVYSNGPLQDLIEKHVESHKLEKDLFIGSVDYVTGETVTFNYSADDEKVRVYRDGYAERISHKNDATFMTRYYVLSSTAIPIAFDYVKMGDYKLFDGGVRNISPLGAVIDKNPDEIYIVNCSPMSIGRMEKKKPNIIDVGMRTMDIVMNEIIRTDIREFIRINRNVLQAKQKDITLTNEKGKPFKYFKEYLFEPSLSLGDTLDFSEEITRRRYDHGRVAERIVMNNLADSDN